MNLMRLVGFVKELTREQLKDEGVAALVLEAEQMRRAGVILTPDFWAGCSEIEQEALALAGDRVAANRAALIGLACLGQRGVAELVAGEDGGKAREQVLDAEEQARNAAAAQATMRRFGLGVS